MTSPTGNRAAEPTPAPAVKEYRFGRAVFIALMVGPALVLLASAVFILFDLFGHHLGG